jgi:purine-binding chemotaxis protein CheW
MAGSTQVVVFSLDEERYALNLSSVERIVRAVEITHLPDAPDNVYGVINVEGRVIPVLNTRKRLGLPQREIDLDDLFIIVTHSGYRVAFVGDEVLPVMEIPEHRLVSSDEVLPGERFVQGMTDTQNGMIIILDASKALSYDEQDRLQSATAALSKDRNVERNLP